ncbi:condensation domain-containing protein [Streptomyces sp. NPDC046727]|uniref:condensation domain-containing protein n=1 Tax=Streptomyces sp. NPDC046727 TaxID=3155373 RepID=UPI0033ED23A4
MTHIPEDDSAEAGLRAVEQAALGHPDVARSAAVIHTGSGGAERLTVYVEPAGHAPTPEPDLIRDFLARTLPVFAVPDTVVLVRTMPLTASGAVDLEALPVPRRSPYGADRSARAELLTELIGAVLGVQRVSTDESFVDLGGHSLLVARLISLVRSVLPLTISMRDVLDAESIASLTARLDLQGRPDDRTAEVPAPPPTRPALLGTWAAGLRCTGPLDQDALAQALRDITARHTVLTPDGTPPALSVVTASEEETAVHVRRASARLEETPDGPRAVGALLVHGPAEHSLLLVVDRAACDEESLDVLVHEWCHAYTARSRGHAPTWELLPGAGPRQGAAESRRTADPAHGRERLAGPPAQLTLPYDRPRPAQPSRRAGSIPVTVPAGLHRDLREVARRYDSTLRMVLQAALATLLADRAGETDVVIGTARHGRTRESLDNVVGRLSDHAVLRFDLSGAPRFGEVVAQARQEALAADERRAPGSERLVDVSEPERPGARHPLFRTALELRTGSGDRPRLPGISATPLRLPTAFDLDLAVVLAETFDDLDEPNGLLGEVRYAADLFDRATAERIAQRWEQLLRAVAANPESSLDQLLTDADAEAAPQGPTAVVGEARR